MKIGILCFTPLGRKNNISDLMLKKTGIYMGHKIRIFRNSRIRFLFEKDSPKLFYKDRVFPKYDIIIIRPGITKNVDMEISTVKQLQLLDISVLNTYLAIHRAKNKIRTFQILNHAKIPTPKTVVIHSLEYLDHAIENLGGFPIILKTPVGTHGSGVVILESKRSLKSATELLTQAFKNEIILIQEYVKEAKGRDIRIFVVGGKVIAAMERKARKGEFRANFHRGANIQIVDLSEEEKDIALRAVKVIGLDIAGVDLLRTNEGPKILEVNSNPGLEGITKATNINVAEDIIRYAEKVVAREKWLLEKKAEES